MSRVKKTWHLLPHNEQAIQGLSGELRLPPVVAQLLLNRNIKTAEDARRFLKAPLDGLYEPERLPGVVQAAERLHEAVRHGRPICIYGDYDVDGVSGTAILFSVLRALHAKVEWHVPHRVDDGYGLNAGALQQIAQNGGSLVVTVDCGIASIDEALEARRLGLELIITDHHEFKPSLPEAAVLVHPRLGKRDAYPTDGGKRDAYPTDGGKRDAYPTDGGKRDACPTEEYPFAGLSGAGVALKLAWALCKLASGGDKVTERLREVLLDAVALASLGTVADVVPLLDENRIIVRHGLARLKSQPTLGLQALLQAAGLGSKDKFVASDIGFMLAPRLNAAGRLGSARLAVELLTTDSAQLAEDMARQLNEYNERRQQLERGILLEARQKVEESDYLQHPALVLGHSQWHQGLIGIVAGRLTDLYGRPALMVAMPRDSELAVGSGRSIPGFKLHEALAACADHLVAHGGHAAAAGFKLRPTAFQLFRDRFLAVAAEHFTAGPPAPQITIDAEIPLSILSMKLVQSIGWLEPYGAGNPQPLFLAGDLQVIGEPRRVGQNERHLSFRVRQQGKDMKAIAFGMGDRLEELMSAQGRCCLVFTPRINEWQGWQSVELQVRDFQPGAQAKLR